MNQNNKSDKRGAAMNAAHRLLAVIEALSGSEVFGARLADVVKALGTPCQQSTVLRDRETLQEVGWATQSDDKRWRLAARPIQIFINFQQGLASARQRIDQVEHNYTRTPL